MKKDSSLTNYWYLWAALFFTFAVLSVYAYYFYEASNYPKPVGDLTYHGHDFSFLLNILKEIKVGLAAIFIAAGTTFITLGRNFEHKKEVEFFIKEVENIKEEKRKLEVRTEKVKTAVISVITREPSETTVAVDVLKTIFPELDELLVTQKINEQDPLINTPTSNVVAGF